MIRIVTLLLLSYCFLNLWSQSGFTVYDEYSIGELGRSFQMGHIIKPGYEIMHDGTGKLFYEPEGTAKESMAKSEPVNMVIRLLDQEKKNSQDIEVDFNDIDIDLSGFVIHYLGQRKFLVFTVGRYRFCILNLSTNRIIGPLTPQIEGAASDSQDGTLGFTEVFHHGQYLIGNAHNFGMFCYNLMDLYNPLFVNHICNENQHLHNGYFFLDKRYDNVYNGLFIDNHRQGTYDSIRFIFQGKVLKLTDDGLPEMSVLNTGLLQLREILANEQLDSLIIDIHTGKLE